MITLTDEQARQVREAMQSAVDGMGGSYALWSPEARKALAILDAALAQPEQEPVATIHVDGSFVHVQWRLEAPNECHLPVYDRPQISPDAEEVLADHRRLVRELDVLLNGDGAARQASLCDIVSQVRRDGIKAAPVAQQHNDSEIEAAFSRGFSEGKRLTENRAAHLSTPVAQQELPAIWYMRDNHTFRKLSENVEQALIELEQEFNEGNTHGMLCSDRKGFQSVHAGDNVTRLEFFAAAREELVKHIGNKA